MEIVDICESKAHKLVSPPLTRAMKSGHVLLRKDSYVGKHSTQGNEEVLVVLEGIGVIWAGEEKRMIRAGQAVYVPPWTVHDVYNPGPGALRYVYVVSPVSASDGPAP